MPRIKVNFAEIPDVGDFGPLPLGKYASRMHVDAYQHDAQGNYATDVNGDHVFWTTNAGDAMWKLEMELLDPAHKSRKVFDQLSFGPGGLKRVKVIYVRGGFADATDEVDLDPEDIDGTYWFIDIDRHEVATEKDGKTPRVSKYTFKAGACTCKTCKQYDGQNVNVNARIGFGGFELMPAKEAKKYAQPGGVGASTDGLCADCQKGVHHHKFEKDGCKCQAEDHPAF